MKEYWLAKGNPLDACTDMHVYDNNPLFHDGPKIHVIEMSAYQSVCERLKQVEGELNLALHAADAEAKEVERLKSEALTCPACATTFALGSDLAAVTTDMTKLNNQRYAQIVRMAEERDHLRESLDMAIQFIAEAMIDNCICNARWSGRDEAQYCAVGCPNCYCESTLATLRERHKKGDE